MRLLFGLVMFLILAVNIHSQQLNWETLSTRYSLDIESFNNKLYLLDWEDGLQVSEDNGTTWQVVFPFTSNVAFNQLAIDKNGIFYAANSGWERILKSTDMGVSWQYTSLNVAGYVLEIDSSNTIWVSNAYKLYKSTDEGVTWDSLNFKTLAIDFNASKGVLSTFNPFTGVYLTSDGGLTWNNILQDSASDGFRVVKIDDNDNIFCAGDDYPFSKIIKSSDLGSTWATIYNNVSCYRLTKQDTSLYIILGIPNATSILYKGSVNGSDLGHLGTFQSTYKIFMYHPYMFIADMSGLYRAYSNIQPSNPNFFPTKEGDGYQFYHIYQQFLPDYYYDDYYYKATASEINFQNKTYVGIWNHYYCLDSTQNKLFILLNNQEKLAFDFNKPAGTTDTLYFDGLERVWVYTGDQSWNILGENRIVRQIFIQTSMDLKSYTLADGIGIYQYQYTNTYGSSYYRITENVISAIIDSTIYNPISLSIYPTFPPSIGRNFSTFDISVNITSTYLALINSLSADVVVYNSGNIIYQNTYQGNIELEKITVSLSSSILSEADSVGIQVRCTDESIFNNEVFYPQSGYHFIPVLSDISWNLIIPNLNVPIPQTMKFFTPNNGIIYGATQGVPNPPNGIKNITIDGGQSFSNTVVTIGEAYIKEIFRTDENTAYMLLSIWGVEKTIDMGSAWSVVLNNLLYGYSISFINNDTGWVSGSVSGGANGVSKIFRTFDGGSNWVSFNTPQQEILTSISFISVTVGYAVSESGKVYYSTDSGETWTFTNATITNQKLLAMFENGTGWLVGERIHRTENNGVSWTQQAEGDFVDAHFFDRDKGWVIGTSSGNKILLYTVNGGTNWTPIDVPETGADYLFIDFVDVSHGWIYSANKKLLKTTNGGVTFTEEENITLQQPSNFSLFQNYPNPFNPSTKISWQSPAGGWQTLKVYDVLGNEVAKLVDEYKPAGNYEIEFNSASSIKNLASGIYFYRLQAGSFIETKKMLLIK